LNLSRAAKSLLWYLREVSGESDYERYVAHSRQHPDAPVLCRRDFERRKMDEREANPQARCC
jgi:uncharacterized short protein YbdD (DUF466 family)